MEIFTQWEGLAILAAFGLLSYLLTVALDRKRKGDESPERFLVADRRVGWFRNSTSIAATWIWAPALFVAAEQGYKHGWVGVFWFTVPNVLCLVVFAFFATIMRKKYRSGFTLSGFMRDSYSDRVQRAYLVCLSGLAVCSFAVQLLAGGLVLATLTGINFLWVTLILSLIAVSYSLRSGIRGSIITDHAQMILIAVVGLVLAPWVVASAGVDVTLHGMAGSSGAYTSLVTGPGAAVFWSFGLSTTIGLLSGPFGDQSFWQRAFASKEREVKKAFIVGAGIFAIVPLTMSLLGFAVAGAGFDLGDGTQLTNLYAILTFLPAWTVIPFLFFILSGLVSTLDSNLSSIGSLAGHDMNHDREKTVHVARIAMIVLAVGATLLANVPGLTIVSLFIFYGTLRASTFLPTVMALLRPQSERGMFWGVVGALVIGVPMSAYGNLLNLTEWKVAGSLAVLLVSGVTVAVFTALDRNRYDKGGWLGLPEDQRIKINQAAVRSETRISQAFGPTRHWPDEFPVKETKHD